jgi:hypothetical protein
MRLVELRLYRIRAGFAETFERAMRLDALPLLRAAGHDVVAFGRSDRALEAWCLIRAYANKAHLQEQQDAFYASPQWKEGPRARILSCIEDYQNALLALPEHAIDAMRTSLILRSE